MRAKGCPIAHQLAPFSDCESNVDAGRRSDAFVSNDPDLGELVDIDTAELFFGRLRLIRYLGASEKQARSELHVS